MILRLLPVALLLASPTAAQSPTLVQPRLTPELQLAVSCAALFSLVAGDQARKAAQTDEWPPMAERGREFFVRISAKVMDSAGLDRAGITALMQAEVAALSASGTPPADRSSLRRSCLTMLDAVVPPSAGG